MGVNKGDMVLENSNDFYSPISGNGYLTPLQRKKWRELHNVNFPLHEPIISDRSVDKKLHGVKKAKTSLFKLDSKSKNVRKKKDIRKKKTGEKLHFILAEDLVKNKSTSFEKKRFFKTRSPQHLRKARFSMPLKFKKSLFNVASSKSLFSSIKHSLDLSPNDINVDNGSPLICQNYESDIFNFEWPSDAELLERQNRARALLQKEISSDGPNCSSESIKENLIGSESVPLYPIFSKRLSWKDTSTKVSTPKRKSILRDTSFGSEQMIIDAGQKKIGAHLCLTCNMLYHLGQEEDEQLHSRYHDTYLLNLKFMGWKTENVIGEYEDGRVIKVTEKDEKYKMKKVQDVLFIANRDLGFPSAMFSFKPNAVFLLFVSYDKKVQGCLVAETISTACPVVLGGTNTSDTKTEPIWKLGSWYASSKVVPALCGINRIWVAKELRRRNVASRLIDCLRSNFIFGHVISCMELAFTDPTLDGREFASAYTKTDNFLVYK